MIAKNLPRASTTTANPFADMTNSELNQIGVELGELVQAELDNDPNAIDTINPRLLRYLKSEGLIKV
jgi:hypothetical protein